MHSESDRLFDRDERTVERNSFRLFAWSIQRTRDKILNISRVESVSEMFLDGCPTAIHIHLLCYSYLYPNKTPRKDQIRIKKIVIRNSNGYKLKALLDKGFIYNLISK